MKVYMIRHGQTDWNKESRLQGRTDIPLNDTGKAAASEAGKMLSDIRFDLCISSPLSRAKETAARVLAENRFPLPQITEDLWPCGHKTCEKGIEILTDERITEYCFGEWEGRKTTGEGYDLPLAEYKAYWHTPTDDYLIPGMEGKAVLVSRVRSFLNELAERFGDTDMNILVAAHGCVFRALKLIADDEVTNFLISAKNCEIAVIVPDPKAEEAQKARGILPESIKYGRKVKLLK